MPFTTFIWLLIKYGPAIVKIVREIVDLIGRLRREPSCTTTECVNYSRRLDHVIMFADSAPREMKAEVKYRLTSLRDAVKVRHASVVASRVERSRQ